MAVGGGGGKDSTWWKCGTPDRPLNSPCPSGLSSLAPRTLALRERLKSCLTAIHCFHEARLDDECAFYTSRAPPSGPTRVCTNPVATLLEWQDALVRLQPTAQLWLHSEPDGRWGTGTGGHLGQQEGLATVQGWLGCDKVFSLSSVSFQLALLPGALHHETTTLALPCFFLLALIYCRSAHGTGSRPPLSSIKFPKYPHV